MSQPARKSPIEEPAGVSDPGLEQTYNGAVRTIEGEERIFFDGYWIRRYDVPDTLAYKQTLIDSLTRRVFHHAEPGINTPGDRLEEVREAYEAEQDPVKKRVLAAMLAGAMLNRGSDILTRIVELEQIGVNVNPDNELLRECGLCFMGALDYGRHARPRAGGEGLDELWGEPFKAFSMSIQDYHESRYLKIALTMRAIDSICRTLTGMFAKVPIFAHVIPLLRELAKSAKLAGETMRSDIENIEIWPRFVAAADRLEEAEVLVPETADRREHTLARRGLTLIKDGGRLMVQLANLRVPMPKTSQDFHRRCDEFNLRFLSKPPAS